MKSYTFTLPKNTKSAKTYKESLMDRVINAYPWMTVESKSDYPSCSYGIEYAGAGDIITLGLSKTHNIGWLPKECANCPFDVDYDFKDEFGTPVKIFDNFVQIGYEVIPIAFGSLNYLKPKTKKTIIDITINIKKRGLF